VSSAPVGTEPRGVPVPAIERELEALWRVSAKPTADEYPVLRACMSNLIVFCRTDQEAGVVAGGLPEVLGRHPARALVLVGNEKAGGDSIDAWVSAHCHLREGTQVCGESVTLSAHGQAVKTLPSTARSLLVGDLPTNLWWATPEAPPLSGALYTELAAMSNQVIYDSLGWLEPVRGMNAMGKLRQDRLLVHDVCWRRLKGWRRILSQGFDPTFAPGLVEHLGSLTLQHGPHALTQCWLLVGWLARRLGWNPEGGKIAGGTELTWRFAGAKGPISVTAHRLPEGPPEILSLVVAPRGSGPAATLTVKSQGQGQLSVESTAATGGTRSLTIPVGAQATMVARQLSDLAPDPLFRETLAVACTMAAALPH
jgi:glucose-6-phosphate dehydrogenase assembly protein OpcA